MERKINVHKRLTSFFVLLAVSILVLIGSSALAGDKKSIKIGVVLPMSGGLELFGQQGIQGAQMAVAEINAAGGVLGGHKLELIVEDNKTDPKTAAEKTKKLILKDKVTAVLGPITSANRNAMLPFINKYKTPLLYATDYEGEACSRYLFCYSAIPDHYIKPFIPYLTKNYGNKFYLFGADYVWPHKMNEAIKKGITDAGGHTVAEEYTPFGVKDFAATIDKIVKSGAEVLVLTLPGADGQTLVKQMTEFGAKDKVKIAFMGFNDNYMSGLTGDQANGVITCNHFIQSLDRPEAKDFVGRQHKMFGKDAIVSFYADSHYGIVMLFKKAIEKAQSVDREKIIDAMPGLSVAAGNGQVTIHEDHHMTLNMLIAEVIDGKLQMKKYIGPTTASPQCAGKL
ncbi:substrate-binding protein [Desulfobacula sp.]|uniref:substrate-binding protein n=1 Tax=Desulfobacula sp. TaxID=2593537 RepID=UPI00262D151B|nr:substrate-binding protein [Desulfobacula sp.]